MTAPSANTPPQPPKALSDLATLSARVGADPLLIQAAGGNTSVKDGAVMWIKASGTRLSDALSRDVFVPTDLPAMREALVRALPEADQPAHFALGDSRLRPSIETSLHAVFPQAVVVHVHCVNTIALAIRADAEAALSARLGAFDWAFVPYVKPGARLALSVRDRIGPRTDVIVLGNHGLIVAAETVDDAERLLDRVTGALAEPPGAAPAPDLAALAALAEGSAYSVPPAQSPLHRLAGPPERLDQAVGGSLYPDHVIFCGVGATALDAVAPRVPGPDGPVFVIAPGRGALIRKDASSGAQALADCLGNVLCRVPPGAELTYLSAAQNAELLDWDAEKYRKALDAG